MHEFSPSSSAYDASYMDSTQARSHGDRTSLGNAASGACLKGILIVEFVSISVVFVVQIFDKT